MSAKLQLIPKNLPYLLLVFAALKISCLFVQNMYTTRLMIVHRCMPVPIYESMYMDTPKCVAFMYINANCGLKLHLSPFLSVFSLSLSFPLYSISEQFLASNNLYHCKSRVPFKLSLWLYDTALCNACESWWHIRFCFRGNSQSPSLLFIAFSSYVAISLFFKATKTMTNSVIAISQETIMP